MKESRVVMGMPCTIEIRDARADASIFKTLFAYFDEIDELFSTYKPTSEISRYNRGELQRTDASTVVQELLVLAEETKQRTNGYFNIQTPSGTIDPSGIVKGWAIYKASRIAQNAGYEDFMIDIGGDVQVSSAHAMAVWSIGIRHPFEKSKLAKVVFLRNEGVATSGNYERGAHIYNPYDPKQTLDEIMSITVIAKNIYEADRFATAAFAMGQDGIRFIESLAGFEGYQIDKAGIATMTSGFIRYAV